MCFSAEASFAAGAVLSVAGVTAVSLTKSKSQLLFASIPLLFAVQQVSEGFLWLALEDQSYKDWKEPSAYFFLIFAQVIWPFWIPLSVFMLEKNPMKKKWLKLLLVAGISLSAYLAFCLIYYPITVTVQQHHIHYEIGATEYTPGITSIIYLLTTVVSLFIPANNRIRFLGLMILLSFITSWIFFNEFVISVWCFFAAVISVIIIFIINGLRNQIPG